MSDLMHRIMEEEAEAAYYAQWQQYEEEHGKPHPNSPDNPENYRKEDHAEG